jgi:succinylglutamate desuccinylase
MMWENALELVQALTITVLLWLTHKQHKDLGRERMRRYGSENKIRRHADKLRTDLDDHIRSNLHRRT